MILFWKEILNKMKKTLLIFTLFSVLTSTLTFADTFTDAIQDLAMYTACIGQYSATQAGGGWYDDPQDFYTPQSIASRLERESGNMTRTSTFYGVCFDYAQFAWNYVKSHATWYRSQGMRENQFWIAGNHEDSSQITLQYPGDRNNYTTIQNGVYVKIPDAGGYCSVRTHKNLSGRRATHHAWIWILRSDGVQFWIDPTWTDNLGYVVYGYVSDAGEEIQCRPSRNYCVNYPNSLNNLPLPPQMGQVQPPSKTANSTNPEETIKDAKFYVDIITGKKIYVSPEAKDALLWSIGFHIAKPASLFNQMNTENPGKLNFGLSFSCEAIPIDVNIWHSAIFTWQIDYFAFANGEAANALLFDINLGYQFGLNYYEFGIYVGGGIGAAIDGSYIPLIGDNLSFAWEWRVGSRLMLNVAALRVELTYMNKTGYAAGFYVGLLL